jgi:hypothetical protein
MKSALVRLSLIVSSVAFAACGGGDTPGSGKLEALKEGMTTAQALEAMGNGPLTATSSDTMRVVGGYRRMRYLLNGADFQVLFARDLPGDVKEPVLQAKESPIVFRNDTLLGWGWRFYVDEAMAKYALPTPLRAIDTLTTPVAPPVDSTKTAPAADSITAPDTTKKA